MRSVTATCRDCGAVETSTFAGRNYRCAACSDVLMDKIRRMAADGMSQPKIAIRLGFTQANVNRWCHKGGIVTNGAEPQQNTGRIHGFGKPPAKLMPSPAALGLVSVFDLAHASIEKNFGSFANPNHP